MIQSMVLEDTKKKTESLIKRLFFFFCSRATEKPKDTLSDTLWKWLYDHFGVYIEDFRFQPEENTVESEEPLSAKRWVKLA